jgi:pyruvate kinase
VRRAKIVCTLGPASTDPGRIGALIDAGMDCARLNMSHGNHAEHAARVATVREQAQKRDRAVAVLLDLQGPKTRIGTFEKGAVELKAGADFMITTRKVVGNEQWVSTDLEELARDVRPGNVILLADGMLKLEVTEVKDDHVHTRVVVGGVLKDHKGLALPGVKVSTPSLTEKDLADVAFGLEQGVDFVALSFARRAEDIAELRKLLRRGPGFVPIVAKIESTEGVDNLEAIIDEADGIMVARGDLGVELGPEKVPLLQKQAIAAANKKGKLVITATEMLESMVKSPRPTRAEASDVANAVLDGTDAVMLSAETAVGEYAVEAVRTMATIVEEIEESAHYRARRGPISLALHVSTDAVARAAVVAADEIEADAIACYTETGATARLLSEYRPRQPIVALTNREEQYLRLALEWGVIPRRMTLQPTTDQMVEMAAREVLAVGVCRPDDWVVITMSMPAGYGHPTNVLKLHRL